MPESAEDEPRSEARDGPPIPPTEASEAARWRSTEPQGGPATEAAPPDDAELTRDFLATVSHADVTTRTAARPAVAAAVPDGDEPEPVVPGYEILERLGRGGMGIVYKARRVHLEKVLALKVLPATWAGDPDRLTRFFDEANIAARLSDAHLLEVYDLARAQDGRPVIVMPYMDGPDLARVIRFRVAARASEPARGRRGGREGDRHYLQVILPLLDRLVDAVAALHQADPPVYHLDIKPSNVLADLRANVRLSDFGLAVLAHGADGSRAGSSGGGTRGFMPPEQRDGRTALDATADVYALGVTLYAALTLTMPHGRSAAGRDEPPTRPPSAVLPGLPPGFDALVLRAIEPRREDRHPSAVELRRHWRWLRFGEGAPPPEVGWKDVVRQRARRHRWLFVNAACLAALISVIAQRLARDLGRTDPDAPWAITMRTVPAVGARLAFVRLDPKTGVPTADVTRAPGERAASGDVHLRPGDYLVEASWPALGQFVEGRRHVPRPGEDPLGYRSYQWTPQGSGLLIPAIQAPFRDVAATMVLVPGRKSFKLPPDPASGVWSRTAEVEPFLIAPHELTAGEYRRFLGPTFPPDIRRILPPGPTADDQVLHGIPFHLACDLLESLGQRLPTEEELVLAATGVRPGAVYPWGDAEPSSWEGVWAAGPAGGFAIDRTPGPRPIAGLFSNVAEWTSTRYVLGMSPKFPIHPTRYRQYVVRGAPPGMLGENPSHPESGRAGIGIRHGVDEHTVGLRRLGVRGARSLTPRYAR